MNAGMIPPRLSQAQFEQVRRLLYRTSRIDLRPGKEKLVEARLSGRLRRLGMDGFDAYLRYLENDSSSRELAAMVDALTTNKTSFFREPAHFEYLRREILPGLARRRRSPRFWCAGCSSGEEPFSLAILLAENLKESELREVQILATDISERVLSVARQASYTRQQVQEISSRLLHKYFDLEEGTGNYRLRGEVARLVRFARLNLMGQWPMQGPFDAIFCRNVMIYFDTPTRERLVQRFYDLLGPGGRLFIGHSESLTSHPHSFRYVQPAVYAK